MSTEAVANVIEQAAKIADKWADKMRAEAAQCASWSAAQAERLWAKDVALFIGEEIRTLATPPEAQSIERKE